MSERDEPFAEEASPSVWNTEALTARPDRAPVSELQASAKAWGCGTVALAAVLLLLTWVVCQWIVASNVPDTDIGSGLTRFFLGLLIVPLLLVAGVLALMLDERAVALRPIAVVLVIVVGGTWGVTWASNASKTYVTPDTAGFVVAINDRPDGGQQVRLADGRVLDLVHGLGSTGQRPPDSVQYEWLAGSSVQVGDLVLAGQRPNPWYVGAHKVNAFSTAPCYLIESKAWVAGDRLRLSIGIEVENQLPAYERHETSFSGQVCLNEAGAAFEILTSNY